MCPTTMSSASSKKPKLAGGNADAVPSTHEYELLQQQRRKLPIWPARKKIISEIQHLECAIVIGETGSGKTTQIPQFLYEGNVHRGKIIACTQPRRVAAITMAQRVAAERGVHVGEIVGHTVRFDDSTSNQTRLKYMTDGMLLREAILDPLMKEYSIIILDEAHERTVHTDVLFGVVKSAQQLRKAKNMLPLKIVVMSATMDVDHFSNYFNSAPVLYLEGRQHPVNVMYTQDNQSDYIFTTMVTVFQIHKEAPLGQDILVFLTGQEEIESCVKSIRSIALDLPSNCPPVLCVPLYAALPHSQQMKAFKPTPPGVRKIILSTNIAETSVTISGIKFVIDPGMVKAKWYDAVGKLDLLKVQHISKAQACQRSGRAGRESAGTCYRLYTEAEFEGFNNMTIPELQRCNLANVTLQLLAMGIKDPENFDFMDKPASNHLSTAIEQLRLLGAVTTDSSDSLALTLAGRGMVAFPLDPCLSKTLLAAKELECLEEILTIVSLLSVDSIVFNPSTKRDESIAARAKFTSPDGDHLTMLAIYRAYKGIHGNKQQWCYENFVNSQNMTTVMDIRRQLRDICLHQGMTMKSCGHNYNNVRKCLSTGFFMNAAELQNDGKYITLSTRRPVSIHPSSVLFKSKPSYIIYNDLVQTSNCYMRNVSCVDPEWLYEIAPEYFRKKKHVK